MAIVLRPPAAGGGAHDALLTATVSYDMPAAISTDGATHAGSIPVPGPGPWYLRELTLTQIGGTLTADPSVSLSLYYDAARTRSGALFPFFSGASPQTAALDGWMDDSDGGDELHFDLVDNSDFAPETAQYRIAVKLARGRQSADG